MNYLNLRRKVLILGMWICCINRVLADYPPQELYYRKHHTDLYPKEVPASRACLGVPDGNYFHRNLDLGDPRCTFVMCSNRRTIVQACPMGTRTEVNMFPPLPVLYRLLRQKHNLLPQSATDINSQQSASDMEEEPEQLNSIEIPFYLKNYRAFVNRFMNYRRRLMVQVGGACNFHDIHGHCGDPFPLSTLNLTNSKGGR